jgi:predicted glutamine amidotransferase
MRVLSAGLAASALLALAGATDACRFWGLAGDGYPQGMLADQLRDGSPSNLRVLGNTNRDGWAIAFVHPDVDPHPLGGPVIRRGGSRANHPGIPDYGAAVDELELLRPRVSIAHVRRCTISHCGVPDPHPFLREGILFAHNGNMSDSLMVDLLTRDDPNYLIDHPPDYDDAYIDSELYFLYLLKYRDEHPDQSFADALRHAVYDLSLLTQTRLNFVLAAGDTLFVLRHDPLDADDPVRYYPAGSSASPFWIAASQAVGSDPSGWAAIPVRSLAVLVPGQAPLLLAVEADPTSGVGEPALAPVIGRATPNPSRGTIVIPLAAPAEGATLSFEVIDSAGRLVWRNPARWITPGTRELSWHARDHTGGEVANGPYWCRIRIGSERSEQRIVILR